MIDPDALAPGRKCGADRVGQSENSFRGVSTQVVASLLAVSIYLHGHNRGWAVMAVGGLVVCAALALTYLIRGDSARAAIYAAAAAVWFGVPAYQVYRNTESYNERQAIKRDFGRQGLSIHAVDAHGIVLNTIPHCVRLYVMARKPNQIWRAIPLDRHLRRSVLGGYLTYQEVVAYAKSLC